MFTSSSIRLLKQKHLKEDQINWLPFLRVRLEQLLRPVLTRNKIGIDSAIERLKSISFIRQGDKWFTHNALTKIQKEILYALGAKLDMLVSNWV